MTTTAGELYFTRLDMRVKPTAGLLLAFTGGLATTSMRCLRVTSGLRLTMPAFYTFDPRPAGYPPSTTSCSAKAR